MTGARVGERRKDPELPGLMARLLDSLSDAEAIGTIVVVAFGVLDPIAELTGLALLALACDLQLQAVLRADPCQIKVFVEEIIRLGAPIAVHRVTTRNGHHRRGSDSGLVVRVTAPVGAQPLRRA